MNGDFPLVRDAFAGSAIGRVFLRSTQIVHAAWRTSRTGRTVRSFAANVSAGDTSARIGTVAAAIAIAAAMQPLARLLMPRTIVPALPWPAFVIVAIFAALVGWRRDAFVASWPESRIARWLRR